MYVKKIELKNIKGFENLSFDLDRGGDTYAGWTVFAGENGSGKSTLLKAITQCLANCDQPSIVEMMDIESLIRKPKSETDSVVNITFILHGKRPPQRPRVGYGETIYSWGFPSDQYVNGHNEASIDLSWDFSDGIGLSNRASGADKSGIDAFFSCAYGPFRRMFGASPDATQLMAAKTSARYVTLFNDAASLSEVDEWLKSLDHKRFEGKVNEAKQLEIVLQILRDDLLPNEVYVDRVDSDGLWLKDRNGVQLAWHDMSDGYRSAVALLADILRHLIASYGIDDLTALDENGKLFVNRSGVVLIDEIDAHLHPEWQRTIGFWLKKHFPNIQFLVTTHSPLICEAADPNGLFVLPKPGSDEKARALTAEEYSKVINSTSDSILLTPLFGLQNTRSEKVVEERAEFSKLRSKQIAGATLSSVEQSRYDALGEIVSSGEED